MHPALPPPASSLRAALRTHWVAKTVGVTLGMTVFFAAYFWLLRHPRQAPVVVSRGTLDEWIGFHPSALPLYLSLWLYVSLALGVQPTARALLRAATGAVVLALLGLGIFYLWPTAVPPTEIDWTRYPSLAFLKTTDAAGNACPSLHVAFAVFSAATLDRILRAAAISGWVRAGNWIWCAGIAYSTVATLQHVVLDAVAGAALGAMVVAGQARWDRVR